MIFDEGYVPTPNAASNGSLVKRAPTWTRLVTAGPTPERFFLDELTITGEWFLIPADRRGDWYDYDAMAEHTCEPGPVPDYARPVRAVRHYEFEFPEEVL